MESLVRKLESWKGSQSRNAQACRSCSHSLGMPELKMWGPTSVVLLCVLGLGGWSQGSSPGVGGVVECWLEAGKQRGWGAKGRSIGSLPPPAEGLS